MARRRFQFRESESFLKRISDPNNLPDGVESPSDLYRKGARLLLNNPELLFGRVSVSSFSQEALDTLEANIVYEIQLNREEITGLRLLLSSLDPKKEKENNRLKEAERIVFKLLEKEDLFLVESVDALESIYEFDYWKLFTPDILRLLKQMGYVKVLPGERLLWLKKKK